MAAKLDFSNPHVIRNEDEYDLFVGEIDRLLDADPAPGSADADRLELLSLLVEAFDRAHYAPASTSTPQSVVQFMLEQHDRTRADLVPIFGSKSRVSEFFNGKRRLSMNQIAALRKEFGIPADVLIDSDPDEVDCASSPGVAVSGASRAETSGDLASLIAAQTTFIEQLSQQLAIQTAAMTEALSMLQRVTTAHQYAMEQFSAVASTVVRPSQDDATGAGAFHYTTPLHLQGSNTEPALRLNYSLRH